MVNLVLLIQMFLISSFVMSQENSKESYQIIPFGEGGTKKMTYDRRQHPQAVLMGDKIHLVYNGGAPEKATKLEKTFPFLTTYNLKTSTFSESVQLPGTVSKDHHYGPVIWVDNNDFLHVLSGCHKTPGTHVISKAKNKTEDWEIVAQIAPSLSYPSVSQIFNKQQLIYYRTGEHRSSWTYSISSDNGITWKTPKDPVVDLNNLDELSGKDHKDMDEASSYHTYLPSKDGKSIHIAFVYYDDNKKNLAEKSYNPLYKRNLGTLKTNLYYVKVDLETAQAYNFDGVEMTTPIHLKEANNQCKIWDTNWRGAGIPPDIIFDKNNNPAFLHVLTEDIFEKLNYYYVRRVGNEWKQIIIAPACHKWNSSHLTIDNEGILHAYLLMDDGYFESKGKGVMNSHGGGTRIEEWISSDDGFTWEMKNTLLKAEGEYQGWRFNNVQPIKTKEGNIKEDMWLFYGWEEKNDDVAQAKAFLLIKNQIEK
ncbi:BNR-4 repeat-containing protein [uncultured Draconibacterium sp.]|uniref:BNR-4 repeat-containing protein n=1 Tax=uncultured Draconibacterium sp. TaxID=1573823 RepID=UPI0025CD809C|nr:BNR-4 repeat-containing protein [uncultured Draconibacterium sp.]